MVGLYLGNEGQKAAELIDGAVIYAPVWDLVKGADYFYGNLRGYPEYAMALNLTRILRS